MSDGRSSLEEERTMAEIVCRAAVVREEIECVVLRDEFRMQVDEVFDVFP